MGKTYRKTKLSYRYVMDAWPPLAYWVRRGLQNDKHKNEIFFKEEMRMEEYQ